MNINNQRRSHIISKTITGISIILLALLATFAYYEMYEGVGIVFTAGILTIFAIRLIDYQYLEVTDEKRMLEFKFYPIDPFRKKEYNAIRFSPDRLRKAEICSQFWGLTAQLKITVLSDAGMATYPSISISGMKNSDRKAILEFLDEIITENQVICN